MSTRYLFQKEDFELFAQLHGLDLELTNEQHNMIEDKGGTTIESSQLRRICENMSGNQTTSQFVNSLVDNFQPLSLSLFVFNDSLWKLMANKQESTDTMLPIVTIPRFHWKQSAITKKNPYGVRRDTDTNLTMNVMPNEFLSFRGLGGEFCGIVEGQLVDKETGPRPIIAPTFPGVKDKVPNFTSQEIKVRIQLGNLKTIMYPDPWKKIDYTFSEHPRVFYEHGLSISCEGKKVHLSIGRKRAHTLHGDVVLFLGRRWEIDTPGHEILHYHVWLNGLVNLLK